MVVSRVGWVNLQQGWPRLLLEPARNVTLRPGMMAILSLRLPSAHFPRNAGSGSPAEQVLPTTSS